MCLIPHTILSSLNSEQVLGLSAIHTCGIIHRDIKPSNILLDAHNNVRIAGFDSAFMKNTTAVRRNTDPPEHFSSSSSSSSSSSPPPSSLRRHGTSTPVHKSTTSADKTPGIPASDENCGTWPYIAPEILSNALKSYKMDKRMYTQAVDYWSLGCLVYELEAGKVCSTVHCISLFLPSPAL
jgi:serine/threonine protein kinase